MLFSIRRLLLFTVDRQTETAIDNPEFDSMKHFSATVLPGARRFAVHGGPLPKRFAFQNPDGFRVLIILNGTNHAASKVVDADVSLAGLAIPVRSMNTLVLR